VKVEQENGRFCEVDATFVEYLRHDKVLFSSSQIQVLFPRSFW
jgi:hypothetical protein